MNRLFLSTILLPLLCASGLSAQEWPQTWDTPCTLDVVLVTFEDATARAPGVSYDYHLHDRPYGTNPGESADSSYTLEDFQRLLSGGYDNVPDFDGSTQTVGSGHPLPEVFGSVRAYFDSVSSGVFELHVRMINPTDDQGYPRWVVLPEIKEHYAEITIGSSEFWDDAQRTAQDSVDLWYPEPADSVAYDIPNNTYDRERRLRHKVVYVYSGVTYTDRDPAGLLHPQADFVTQPNAPSGDEVGYRYVMGEREGWGHNGHDVDEFAAIGTHVHEIGHLLGFSLPTFHPDGVWVGTNPYTGQTTGDVVGMPPNTVTVRFTAANLSGWGSMQSGAHGPEKVGDGGYTAEFRSCPNPYNPFFRMDLGWNTHQDITTTTLNQRIEPGPGHYYVVPGANGQDYLLDFRTAEGFGRYTGWYRFTSSPGLLLWRRTSSRRASNALLIPADGRSIVDARQRPGQAEPEEEDLTYTYVWQDRLSDPFGAVEQDGPFGPLPGSPHRPTITQATDATHLRHVTDTNPDPGDSHLAFRNIRNNGDHALVDIYTNYWSGEITGSVTWSGTVYVGGDVTVPEGTTLTIEPGTVVQLAGSGDMMGTGHSTTKAEMLVYGNLIADGVTFTAAAADQTWGGLVFYGDAVNHTTTSMLTGCTIEDALYGVRLRTVGWTVGDSTVEGGQHLPPLRVRGFSRRGGA